jgi:hypothetical protein
MTSAAIVCGLNVIGAPSAGNGSIMATPARANGLRMIDWDYYRYPAQYAMAAFACVGGEWVSVGFTGGINIIMTIRTTGGNC